MVLEQLNMQNKINLSYTHYTIHNNIKWIIENYEDYRVNIWEIGDVELAKNFKIWQKV